MGDMTPRSGRHVSRSSRERRAYQLAVVGGTAGVVLVVGLVLAVIGVIGFGVPVLAAIVAAICFVLFRGTVSR
ncbi:MAG TPA: hypothetical protein VH256_00680 [Thermoleophilaceae bacterium]|jgi:hypothetical protein|nr:hypothetical protein [Thermoleophilaceae bacterium]